MRVKFHCELSIKLRNGVIVVCGVCILEGAMGWVSLLFECMANTHRVERYSLST